MTLSVSVPAVNLREVADEACAISARVAKNANALRPLQAYTGKNLLMNGDKSLSQRGDFSSPEPVTENRFLLDRFFFTIAGVGEAQATHNPYSVDAQGQSILYEVTVEMSTDIFHSQLVEDFAATTNRQVTYTARVKSNMPVNIYVSTGVNTFFSRKHSGNGGWETLSVIGLVGDAPTQLKTVISTYDGVNHTNLVGDYMEVGHEMLELGSEFTGFEVVNPATQLMQCRRYFQLKSTIHQVSDLAYEMRTTPVQGGVAGAYTYTAEL